MKTLIIIILPLLISLNVNAQFYLNYDGEEKENQDSVSFFNGVSSYYEYDYEAALNSFTHADHEYRVKALPYEFDINLNVYGNLSEAQNDVNQLESLLKNQKNSLEYAQMLSLKAYLKNQEGKFQEAIPLESQAIEIEERLDTLQQLKAFSYANFAYACARCDDFTTAELYAQNAESIAFDGKCKARVNDVLSLIYYLKSDFDNALDYGIEAQKHWQGNQSLEHAYSLLNLSQCYKECGEVDSAYYCLEIAGYIIHQWDNQHDDNLAAAKLHRSYAEMNLYMGETAEAINHSSTSLEILEEYIGKNNYDYVQSLLCLANSYLVDGDYFNALEKYNLAEQTAKNLFGTENLDYAKILLSKAESYCRTGNYSRAKEICRTISTKMPANILDNSLFKADMLTKLAKYCSMSGNYADALANIQSAVNIITEKIGRNNLAYANALDIAALNYFNVGDYETAAKLQSKSLTIRENLTVGKSTMTYAGGLSLLAKAKYRLGQRDSAIIFESEALDIFKKVEKNLYEFEQSKSKSNLAFYKCELNPAESIKNEQEVLTQYETFFPNGHTQTANSFSRLAYYYGLQKNYVKAVEYEKKAIEVRNSVVKNHPDNILSYQKLSEYYAKTGDTKQSVSYALMTENSLEKIVETNFSFMPLMQRTIFWEKHSGWFGCGLLQNALESGDNMLTAKALDGQLLFKGLLLNTEIEIRKAVENSGNQVLINDYETLMDLWAQLGKLYAEADKKHEAQIDKLRQLASVIENRLFAKIQDIADYKKSVTIKTNDIKNALKSNDLAVEFVNFPYDGDTLYAALVIKKDMPFPKMLKLFAKKNFRQNYNMIWQPLEDYFNGVENICFSPSGILHSIPCEYLADGSGTPLCDRYRVSRLTSLREIALKKTHAVCKKAIVFGGLTYKLSGEEIDQIADGIEKIAYRSGGLLPELKGSQRETEYVAQKLQSCGYKVAKAVGADGTEDAFKKFSGDSVRIINISTHGFFNNAATPGSNMLHSEFQSLCCAGLYMSGASSVSELYIPEIDDGIMTAQEISEMSFKGLELVVLSACQTGLGTITGDGVFGLQRGFKKAGAKTIVMSLRKVEDNATALLIESFYDNISAGMSLRTAFADAQKKLRKKLGDNSDEWTAFIMVD